LFNFDRDVYIILSQVQPLLAVLTGKILEQSTLELEQEEEMKNIRQARTNFLARLHKEKMERKEIEDVEIKRKNDFENVKKIKKLDKFTKICTQQKLISRVFSKVYLQGFTKTTVTSMSSLYKNFNTIKVQDKYNSTIYPEIDKLLYIDEKTLDTLYSIESKLNDTNKEKHSNVVNAKKQIAIQKKLEEDRLKQEEKERQQIALEEQKERRRKRAILRLQRDIGKEIFGNPTTKGEYNNEEITEIDNNESDGAYSNIFINLSWCIWRGLGYFYVLTRYY
jgi:hypothetical protein